MLLSGEHRIKASPAKIRSQFQDPRKLSSTLPGVISVEALEPGQALVEMKSFRTEGLVVKYLFYFENGETNNDFAIGWRAMDEKALFANARMQCSMKPEKEITTISFTADVEFRVEEHYVSNNPEEMIRGITQLLDQVADNLAKEQRHMSDHKSDLEDVVSKAEDAVVELEHEAEEAAAKGFLGGPQMWGWIALGILIVVLLIFFK